MTRRRPAPCSQPGCPALTTTSHCPTHTPPPWATSTRSARLPPNWRQLRRRILKRDRHRCQQCGASATEVDHIVNNDDHTPSNLQALCHPCHDKKTAGEAAAARWGR